MKLMMHKIKAESHLHIKSTTWQSLQKKKLYISTKYSKRQGFILAVQGRCGLKPLKVTKINFFYFIFLVKK
jgi:hypothetical protein